MYSHWFSIFITATHSWEEEKIKKPENHLLHYVVVCAQYEFRITSQNKNENYISRNFGLTRITHM